VTSGCLAAQARAQDPRDELAKRFADQPTRADFIVVVDASRSMVPLVRELRRALPLLVEQFSDGDHLSVLRFSNDASEYLPDRTITTDSRAVLIREITELAEPTVRDQRTDLVAAMGRTLEELGRPDFSPVQVVVFISDFCHEPPDTKRTRPILGTQCWTVPTGDLEERANRVLTGHRVRVIALALERTNEDGLAALRRVFPNTLRVDTRLTQIGAYFGRLKRELAYERLAAQVYPELREARVHVQLAEPWVRCAFGGETPVTLRFSHSMPHLGVRFQVVQASVGNEEDVTVTFPSQAVAVDARQVGELRGTLRLRARPQPWRPARAVELGSKLYLTVAATAMPDTALRQLNLEPKLRPENVALDLQVRSWVGRPAWVFLGAAVVTLAAVSIPVCWARRRRPAYLAGTLVAWEGVREVASWELTNPKRSAATLGGAGSDYALADAGPARVQLASRRTGWCGAQVVHEVRPISGQITLNGRPLHGASQVFRGAILQIGPYRVRWDGP
jgi:hypothetical protein